MSIEYSFTASDGSEGKISSAELQNYMMSAGIQAMISPDGMTAKIVQGNQEFEGPVKDIVEQYYGKVGDMLPSADATDFSTIDNTLKAGIAQFNSDSLKRKYLQIALENAGVEQAQIVGSGDNWFRHDPVSGTYYALTNRPGQAEISDVLLYAPQAARAIGSMIGSAPGAVAAMTGLGAVPGFAAAAAGSAAGGLAGKTASMGLQQMIDPAFGEALRSMTEEERAGFIGDQAIETATDAAAGAIPFGVGQAGKAFFAKGGLTRLGGWGARGVEAGSKAAQELAKLGGQSELVRGLTTAAVFPPAAAAQGVGLMMQAPQWLSTKGLGYVGQGLEKIGKTQLGQRLQNAAATTRGRLDPLETATKNYSNFWIPKEITPRQLRTQARDTLGNLAEESAEGIFQRGMAGLDKIEDPLDRAKEFTRLANQRHNITKMAETVGRTFDASGTIGRGLEQAVDKGAQVGFKAAQGGFGLTSGLARGVRTGMDFAAPLEGRAYLHGAKMYGEENLPWRQ